MINLLQIWIAAFRNLDSWAANVRKELQSWLIKGYLWHSNYPKTFWANPVFIVFERPDIIVYRCQSKPWVLFVKDRIAAVLYLVAFLLMKYGLFTVNLSSVVSPWQNFSKYKSRFSEISTHELQTSGMSCKVGAWAAAVWFWHIQGGRSRIPTEQQFGNHSKWTLYVRNNANSSTCQCHMLSLK